MGAVSCWSVAPVPGTGPGVVAGCDGASTAGCGGAGDGAAGDGAVSAGAAGPGGFGAGGAFADEGAPGPRADVSLPLAADVGCANPVLA